MVQKGGLEQKKGGLEQKKEVFGNLLLIDLAIYREKEEPHSDAKTKQILLALIVKQTRVYYLAYEIIGGIRMYGNV